MPSRAPGAAAGPRPSLFNSLLARAEAAPSPAPLPDPHPHHLLPRSPGDAHLQASFEHALLYQGLAVSTTFSIPVRPPPRPKGRKGKRSRPRSHHPSRAPAVPRPALRSSTDLLPGRVLPEPDRNARILAEDALHIDRNTRREPPPLPGGPSAPIPVSDSSGDEFVLSEHIPRPASRSRSNVETISPTRASPRLKDAGQTPATPTTPTRNGKMQRLRRGAASICPALAKPDQPADPPASKPQQALPEPAPPVEKERSPKVRVSKTVASPVKRLSDRPSSSPNTDKNCDEILEVDIIPVRISHPSPAQQVSATGSRRITSAPKKAKDPNGSDGEGSWLSDEPLRTGDMPKTIDVDDSRSPAPAPAPATPLQKQTPNPKVTPKRSPRLNNLDKKDGSSAAGRNSSTTTTAKAVHAAVAAASKSPQAGSKRKEMAPQSPAPVASRKRRLDPIVTSDSLFSEPLSRKTPRTSQRNSPAPRTTVSRRSASPALPKRKASRSPESSTPKRDTANCKLKPQLEDTGSKQNMSNSKFSIKPHPSSSKQDLSTSKPSVKPSPRRAQKDVRVPHHTRLCPPRRPMTSPKKKPDSKQESSKASLTGANGRPSSEYNTTNALAVSTLKRKAETVRDDSGASTSPLREKLAVNTRLTSKTKSTLFSRASETQVATRQERRLFSPLSKNLRHRKEAISPAASPETKKAFPVKCVLELRTSPRHQQNGLAESPEEKKILPAKAPSLSSTPRRESPRSGNSVFGRQTKSPSFTKNELHSGEASKKPYSSPSASRGMKRSHSDLAMPELKPLQSKEGAKREKPSPFRGSRSRKSFRKAQSDLKQVISLAPSLEAGKPPQSSLHRQTQKTTRDAKPFAELPTIVAPSALSSHCHGSNPEIVPRSSSQIRLRLREPTPSGALKARPELAASVGLRSTDPFISHERLSVNLNGKQSLRPDDLAGTLTVRRGNKKGRVSSSPVDCTPSPLWKKREKSLKFPAVKTRLDDPFALVDDFLHISPEPKEDGAEDSLFLEKAQKGKGNVKGTRSPAKRARGSPQKKPTRKGLAKARIQEVLSDSDDVIEVEVTMSTPSKPVPKHALPRLSNRSKRKPALRNEGSPMYVSQGVGARKVVPKNSRSPKVFSHQASKGSSNSSADHSVVPDPCASHNGRKVGMESVASGIVPEPNVPNRLREVKEHVVDLCAEEFQGLADALVSVDPNVDISH